MANTPIRAVLFDMGGTLEDLYYDDASRLQAARGLRALLIERGLDPGLPIANLQAVVLGGIKAYQDWREKSEVELPPERVWADYVFAGCGLPGDRLEAAAEDITLFYENHFHVRCLRPEAPALLAALHERGFRLGIISNILSRLGVPFNLKRYGIHHYFDPVLTSSEYGRRKPHPSIFLEASRRMGLPPQACAYVGDTISRDVVGARRAGYGLAIQIKSFLTDKSDRETDVEPPDAVIQDLMQVVDLVDHTERVYGH